MQRREFLKCTAAGLVAASATAFAQPPISGVIVRETGEDVTYASRWLKVSFPLHRPGVSFLALDAAGSGRLSRNLLRPPQGVDLVAREGPDAARPVFKISRAGDVFRYTDIRLGGLETLDLVFTVKPDRLRVAIDRTIPHDYETAEASPLRMLFDPEATPPSPLGRLKARGELQFPVLLHFPDHGSLLLRAKGADALVFSFGPRYRKLLGHTPFEWIDLYRRDAPRELQLAVRQGWEPIGGGVQRSGRQHIELDLCAVEVYPEKETVESDPALLGVRRAWLNLFQFRPDLGVLSNNSVSDNCALCLYMYADQALFTPPLFDGFRALDVIRTSLESYFAGVARYDVDTARFVDSDPSMIIAAWDYVQGTNDEAWLRQHHEHLALYSQRMVAADRDGDGISESSMDGVIGTGHDGLGPNSSNWWDAISFGWKDAYAAALQYRAYCCLADLERRLGATGKAKEYQQRARMIRRSYYDTFYNPATGVLAGWRSKDGKLHDYYFTFVNGIATAYGIVTQRQANAIMDRMQAKMKEVGYNCFQYGLPGNLTAIPPKDMCGIPVIVKPGRDFQVYQNGGATGVHAYAYIQALYTLARRTEANAILEGMLSGYRDGLFQNGVPPAGVGNGADWKRWDGSPCGYEGYLADTFYALTSFVTGRLNRGVPIPAAAQADNA
jgi:hypothetical protein